MSLFFQRKTQLSNFPFNLLSLELNNPIASSLLGNHNTMLTQNWYFLSVALRRKKVIC